MLFFFFITGLCQADYFTLEDSQFEYSLNKSIHFWSNDQLERSYSKIGPELFLVGAPPSVPYDILGYSDKIIWKKVSFKAAADLKNEHWVLKFSPFDEWTSLYLFANGKKIHEITRVTENTFDFMVDPGMQYDLIMRSAHSNFVKLELFQYGYFKGQLKNREFELGIFFGALLILIIYNCFIFFSVKERSYIYYVAYLVSTFFSLGTLEGLFPFNEWLTSLVLFAVISYMFFSYDLLGFSRFTKKSQQFFYVFFAIGFAFFILSLGESFLPFVSFIEHGSDLFLVCTLLYLIGTGVTVALKAKTNESKLYVAAWTPLFLALCFYLTRVHIFKVSAQFIDLVAINSSVLIQTLIYTVAFAYRVKNLQIESARQEEKALEAERMRNLVRVICHDIANPLTVILAHTSWKKDDADPAWRSVARASDKIYEILQKVKMLQAIESGKQQFEKSAVGIDKILEGILDTFSLRFQEKNITFVTEVKAEYLKKTLEVDPTLFESSVINNLFSNATKFSYPNSRIYFRVNGEDEKFLFLEVEDEGMGIPKEMIPALFTSHAHKSRQGTKGEKGTGFGMPLIKNLLVGMGGDIEVVSKTHEEFPGEKSGTKFILKVKKFVPKA